MTQRKTNKAPSLTKRKVSYKGAPHTVYKRADGKDVVKVFNKRSHTYSYVVPAKKKGGHPVTRH